jgi:hypothetical protein
MMLRDHPLMIRKRGYHNWPPRWTTTNHDHDDKPIGEVGNLEDERSDQQQGFYVYPTSRLPIYGFHGL